MISRSSHEGDDIYAQTHPIFQDVCVNTTNVSRECTHTPSITRYIYKRTHDLEILLRDVMTCMYKHTQYLRMYVHTHPVSPDVFTHTHSISDVFTHTPSISGYRYTHTQYLKKNLYTHP